MNKNGMGGAGITLIIIGLLALFTVLWAIGTYNSLVQKDVSSEKAWGNVETAYQRRADLIPNLVEVVKGVANFEKSTYLAVTEARTKWLNAQTVDEKMVAGQEMESSLSRLLVTVENYPELKANENFLSLQDELAGTENRVKFERDNYNEEVKKYKQAVRMFPSNIIANMYHFDVDKWKMFEAEEGADTAPEVSFD